MSIVDLIAVLSFGLACFSAGYSLGKDHTTHKAVVVYGYRAMQIK